MFLATLLLLAVSSSAHAQDSGPVATESPFVLGATEWMVSSGPAFGVRLFHSERGYKYFLQSLSWGRVLSRPLGPEALRGTFEWAFEVVPLYAQYDPGSNYGLGFSPLTWRWNFEPRGKVGQFAELSGGALWTRDAVPSDTTSANFTAHLAYGVRYFFKPTMAFVAGYRFHHISNGNRLERNPGINAHVAQLGLSLVRLPSGSR